ncbi:S41 family peptidase [Hymenobacter lapidiphilus]|uniref:Tail specific protease domain-containing protein n=1 Tax=Hymenobacter lapidiphilus TaxID=2608003 RepID=A0A7Y7U6N7_9BACT|nr:S41 family peptidase [Hymenobacter lapidiphilus]NVO31635.1 hypothetical protein [Hymenobacter lapidiphilus]
MPYRYLLPCLHLLCWLWPTSPALAQLSVSEQQSDFAIFRTALQEAHGGLTYYIRPAELARQCDSVARTFRPAATREAYYLKLRYLLTLLRHGHSRIDLPGHAADYRLRALQPTRPYLPLQVRILSQRLYLQQDCSAEQVVPAGVEIVAINGVRVAELLATMAPYMPADGRNTTFKYYMLSEYYYFHFLYQLLYPDATAFRLRLAGSRREVEVRGQLPAQLAQTYQARTGRSISQYAKPLRYQSTLAPGVAYLKVGSFFKGFIENRGQQFQPFIDSVVADLRQRGTRHLVLDVRSNEGGGDGYAEYLFARLTTQPFTPMGFNRVPGRRFTTQAYARDLSDEFKAFASDPGQFLLNDTSLIMKPKFADTRPIAPAVEAFTGNLYVLTNGGTFSASSYLVNYLYRQRCASGQVLFIGEENGGDVYSNVLCAGQSYKVELPSSHILLDLPLLCGGQLDRTPPVRRLPDFYVQPTGRQLAQGEDAEMNFTLRYIRQHPAGPPVPTAK